jgi:hypothetical protein
MNQPVLQRTAVDIIKRALRLLGVIDAELSLNDVDRDQGIEVLNDMVKAWQQQGFHLWTMSEAVLFLKQGQAKYSLGMGCTDAIKDGFGSTTTTADYVPLSLSLDVVDGSVFSIGENILITLDNGLKFETSVQNIVSNTLTINSEPTDNVTSGNAVIYNYEYIDRPLSLVNARFREAGQQTDIPTYKWARTEYFEQPDKESQGTVTCWYYTPQLTCGELYVWQTPANNSQQFRFTYIRPTEVTPNNADNPDFPSEWFLCLAYNLAYYLADEYLIPDNRFQRIAMKASQLLKEATDFDNEDTYIQLQPDHTR